MKIYFLELVLNAIKLLFYITKWTQTPEIYQVAPFFSS